MSIFTHTRCPTSEEAPDSYRAQLKECETFNRRTGRNQVQWLIKFSKISRRTAKKQLEDAREVQKRIDFNDKARRAGVLEGDYHAGRRRRDKDRENAETMRRNAKILEKRTDRESDKEDREWRRDKRAIQKDLYVDVLRPGEEIDASQSSSGGEASGGDSDVDTEPLPRYSRDGRRAALPTGGRRPAPLQSTRPEQLHRSRGRTEDDQQAIEDAINLLRLHGIETVTPNGCK